MMPCDEFRLVALGVGVFDAEDHGAALLARKQPVKQRRSRSSDVQVSGRRGRKTHPHAAGIIDWAHSLRLALALTFRCFSLANLELSRPTRGMA